MSKYLILIVSVILFLGLVGNVQADLRVWYPLDEAPNSPNAVDFSGNGFDGVVTDANFTGAGGGYNSIGGALDFDLGDPQVAVPNGVFSTISEQITIALWIFGDPCTQPINQDMWYANWPGGGDLLFAHIPWGDTNSILFNVGDGEGAWEVFEQEAESSDIYMGKWNHWVWVKDGGEMRAYLNGELWNSNDGYTNPIPSSLISDFLLGNGWDGPYDGLVDDFAIWDHPLSAAEVTLIYDSGVSTMVALARKPNPADGAHPVDPNVVLAWKPGNWAADTNGHEVYFGTDLIDVEDADTTDTTGIFRGAQDGNTFDPPGALQLAQTYYWRIDEVNEAYSGTDPPAPPNGRWKGPVWSFRVAGQAYNPNPADGGTDVPLDVVLSWSPGIIASSHDVYFGDDEATVTNADTSTVGIFRGNQVLGANSYDPCEALALGQTYYWRIDEVNASGLPEWPGDVWSFTATDNLVVDTFNTYADYSALTAVWNDYWVNDLNGEVFLETTIANDGNSMKYDYTNSGGGGPTTPRWAEVYANTSGLVIGSDWTASNVAALSLQFYGQADNDPTQQMWVALEDSTGPNSFVEVPYDLDMNDITNEEWREWFIALDVFSDAGLDLTDVAKIYIGFGERGSTVQPPKGFGDGTVYFDDIRLYPPTCVTAYAVGDFTGECLIDNEDLEIMAADWLVGDYNLVPVAPSADPCGWWEFNDPNDGTTPSDSSGNGYDANFAGWPNDPDWQNDANQGWCLDFDGTDSLSIPNDVFASVSTEITIALWMKGSTVDVQNEHDVFYANADKLFAHIPWPATELVHWSTDDGEGGFEEISKLAVPSEYSGAWNHWAFTKNANTGVMAIYHDGILWHSGEGFYGTISGITDVEIANGYDGGYIGQIDDFRVYDRALSEGELRYITGLGETYIPLDSPADIYDGEPPRQKKVNFRDYALMADNWLQTILFP